jgi:tRNA(adenine34) deaminase
MACAKRGAGLGNYRLDGCELFVTLEPCAMCSGAMLHARCARRVRRARSEDRRRRLGARPVRRAAPEPPDRGRRRRAGRRLRRLLAGLLRQRAGRSAPGAHPLRDDALRTPDERFAACRAIPGAALRQRPAGAGRPAPALPRRRPPTRPSPGCACTATRPGATCTAR